MYTLRVIGTVVGGLAGWLLRLLFLASVAVGGYGAYIAWFESLGQGAPGHDRLTGSIVMAIAFGVSLIAWLGTLLVPPLSKRGHSSWYLAAYWVFTALFVTLVLPLSSGLRNIGTWERTNVPVTATATGCYADDSGGDGPVYYCDLSWTVNGHQVSQWQETHDQYPDGTAVALWADPNTGGSDDHDWVPELWSFIGAAFGLAISTATIVASVMLVKEDHTGARRWVKDMSWWTDLPKRPAPPPPPKPAPAPEINDAIPIQYQTDIQDKRP